MRATPYQVYAILRDENVTILPNGKPLTVANISDAFGVSPYPATEVTPPECREMVDPHCECPINCS